MSDSQDYADLNKPLPDPGPRDGKHGEGDNWEYGEHGQSETSSDDEPRPAVTEDGSLSPGSTATGSPTALDEDAVEETDKDRADRHD
ncbi:hypothetical protein [Glaciihabitans sp. UYNi722]|uniref:hypothetical protein n=1 Tax=Glaciihabitans sp. UYNi722 TaxID=3156344 RepID=UPI0033967DF9